jgi:hypothetical protein
MEGDVDIFFVYYVLPPPHLSDNRLLNPLKYEDKNRDREKRDRGEGRLL